MAKRTVRLLSGEQYFDDKLSIYVNRNVESYELTEHHHDFLEISYVSEGVGTHHVGVEVTSVSRGDLFVIPMGASHVFRPSSDKKKQLVVYNCIVTMEAIRKLLRLIPGGSELEPMLELPYITPYKDLTGEAQQYYLYLHREFSVERIGREAALYTGLLQLLIYLTRLHLGQLGQAQHEIQTNNSSMDQILAMLQRNYARPYTLKQLAELSGVGERQFQRLFQQYTGETFSGYLQNTRIHAACQMLKNSSMKITDISAAAGYHNSPYFNELFKRHTGYTPREYRSINKPSR
jgi:AraC family L-rhamnose operon transcriptional activator RhaR